jgi:hypothetical protein
MEAVRRSPSIQAGIALGNNQASDNQPISVFMIHPMIAIVGAGLGYDDLLAASTKSITSPQSRGVAKDLGGD